MATPRKKSLAGLALLMGPMGKKKAPRDSESAEAAPAEDADGHPLDDAMSDLLQAIQDEDPVAMADAFRSAVQLADDDGPVDEGDADEEM